jgi:hypothetical protein
MGKRVSIYLRQERVQQAVNSIHVTLHVATTPVELLFCPSVYLPCQPPLPLSSSQLASTNLDPKERPN